ncbi:hypothetical protein [Agrococcus jenensis]|uniref:Uncharacterized protein n=1 Tax=Agrococcus jenensis TaxID=46353 RepID=A0A3N2AQB4_9MICO|nr:hypothetical protein [Agrococcus jenensis]ROR65243.1 hypothetical protein EDD26_0608 [Agrococcus jenensis]
MASDVEGPARRDRRWARVAAAALGALALCSLGVPLLHQTLTQAAATRLSDGTLAAPDLGAVDLGGLEGGAADGGEPGDRSLVAVADGTAARVDGSAVHLTAFADGSRTESTLGLRGDVLGVALSPTADLLAAVDATGALSLFEVEGADASPLSATTVQLDDAAGAAVATSADGAYVAVAPASSQRLQLRSRGSGPAREVDLDREITAVASGPASTVYALTDNAVFVLDAAAGRVLDSAIPPSGGPTGVALVDDGAAVAVWNDAELLLLDPRSLHASARYDPADPITGAADGATDGTLMVATGGSVPRLALVELGSGATLSEIRLGTPLPTAALGHSRDPGSLLVATTQGVALGSWEASRVPWPMWWAVAASLALLAGVCVILAVRADPRALVAAAPTIAESYPAVLAVPTRELAERLTQPGLSRAPPEDAPRPGESIADRMAALSFDVVAPASEQRVVELIRSEALGTSDDTTEAAVDRILVGSTVTGGVRRHGVRVGTFVVDLSPAADDATRARFRVRWFLTTPAMVPFVGVHEEHSVALEPLRELAERLAHRLQHPDA